MKVKDLHARRGVPHLRVHGKGGKTRYIPIHAGALGDAESAPDGAGTGTRLATSHVNPVYLTRRIPIETKDNASKKFNIGLSVTHVYGIEVMADTHDNALLKMDSWLRGNLPANAMKAKIRSSDVNVIGLGAVAYGRISEVGEISANTRDELAARGKLPETSLHHLLPLPPSSLAKDDGTAEPNVERD